MKNMLVTLVKVRRNLEATASSWRMCPAELPRNESSVEGA